MKIQPNQPKSKQFLLLLFLILLSFSTFPLWGKVNFSDLDLSADNRLLFMANSSGGGAAGQSALFTARLPDPTLRQLSAFPEKMDLIDSGRVLQIRNAFGALRLPISGGLPRRIPGFPSFAGGSPALPGRVEDMAVSADGRFLLYIEPVSAAYGNLIMLDAGSGAKVTIALRIERPDRVFPASWSPDSGVFVYVRGGKLYYYTVDSVSAPGGNPVDEKFRLIGEGDANSVHWGRGGDFFYLRGSTVYRVRGAELFARALYADFLAIGTVAGKIPFEFNPGFDSFSIAPDARSLLLSKGGRNIFYVPLNFDDYEGNGNASLPYLAIPRSCLNFQVLWSAAGTVTILSSVPAKKAGQTSVLAWRLSGNAFVPLSAPLGVNASLSPDGTKALVWGEGGIVLYDYINWKTLDTISKGPAYSCVWIGNDDFVTGDDRRIERIRLVSGSSSGGISRRDLICLSQITRFGFEDSDDAQPRILAQNGNSWYITDGRSPWAEIPSPKMRAPSQVSSGYRVYLDRQSGGPYENLPMIRNIASVGTASLLPGIKRQGGLRELGLCFDLYDDAEGLPEALDALNRFGVKATFFLGGEFIRRYPSAAADIAAAGHEAASLFFAPLDLSDARYRISSDFISRGLARNEDEFYRATGRELALLWHPPYYASSPEVSAAAAQAGYTTVTRGIDPLDWVSREDEVHLSLPRYSASDMVDRIMTEAKKPGAVVPIRLGMLSDHREDYLFNRLNVLLDALVRDGYTVVTVSTLLEHTKP